ncbi:MAG TPA: aspartate aminotransferase family protein [Bacteroidales bacterium]|nr:aspartate aminotransferase family protein [Bacteroidales bacterium]
MQDYRQIFLKYIGQTSPEPMMLDITGAEGVFLHGPAGEKYIDLISGVSVSNTGHRHPRVVRAIKDQADDYLHLMVYGEFIESPQVRYAEKICSLLPPGLDTCFFVNSGSEAVEGAMKLAKRFTGRTKIVSFNNAYHGSTHGALSIQGSEQYKNAFRPLLPDVWQIGFNDFSSLGTIDSATACVIVEPVQAEAGVIYPVPGFLRELRRKCTASGALLVFDEVQTGFGRTGSIFACEKFGVTPDIIVLAKALGGGLPLGAFISSYGIMSTLSHHPVLGHITTFGGHPLCCAAGLAALEVILEEDLAGKAKTKSDLFRQLLVHPAIKEIRGDGLLMAAELNDPYLAAKAVKNAPRSGIILDYFLFCDSAFRIAPPLVINEDEIRLACERINNLLELVSGK